MAVTQWSDEEDEALQGLPLDAQLLYLRGLRRLMDYATGEVGRHRRTSWQALGEVLYVEPHHGCEATGSLSRERVRRAARWLERSGLVVMRSIRAEKHLIFYLPMASRDKYVQKQPDRNPTDEADRREAAPYMGLSDEPAHAETHEPDQHPLSDKTSSNGYIYNHSIDEKPSSGSHEVTTGSPQTRLAVFLRRLGVDVLPLHPLVTQWISELEVTPQECRVCADVCKRYLGSQTPIPPLYFDRVLRSQRARISQPPSSKQERRKATYAGLTGNHAGSNVIELWPDSAEVG